LKTTQIECVTREDYLAHLGALIENQHDVSKSGGRRGGQIKVAKHYGVTAQQMANVMNGYASPTAKMLERDGLEAKVVYITNGKSRS
jgi:hypothetical protein